jgi:ribosome-associated protein YbcJ (S4-like RNA binding protein)
LSELIKETSTDSEYYTLDAFMKKYGILWTGAGKQRIADNIFPRFQITIVVKLEVN